jgi:nucleoid DNA-binding protein
MNYYVAKNSLTTPPTFAVRVPRRSRLTLKDAAKRLVDSTTLTQPDILAVLTGFRDLLQQEVARGTYVTLDEFATFYPSIRAKLPSEDAPLPSDAKLMVKVRIHPSLTQYVRAEAKPQRTDPPNLVPDVRSVTVVNGSATALAANAVLTIRGRRLTFDPAKADEGVFLRNKATAAEVKCTQVAERSPSRIQVVVPSGLTVNAQYEVLVRARNTKSTILRQGAWNGTLQTASGPSGP